MIIEALKRALTNIESSAKFSLDKHEEDNSMLIYIRDFYKFCEYLEEEQLYPIGICVNVPLTHYWRHRLDIWGGKVLGFLFHDLKSDNEKWIHIDELTYEQMMLWFYDESDLKDKVNVISK